MLEVAALDGVDSELSEFHLDALMVAVFDLAALKTAVFGVAVLKVDALMSVDALKSVA